MGIPAPRHTHTTITAAIGDVHHRLADLLRLPGLLCAGGEPGRPVLGRALQGPALERRGAAEGRRHGLLLDMDRGLYPGLGTGWGHIMHELIN